MKQRKEEYWLACLKGIRAARKQELSRRAGSAAALYNIEETERQRGPLVTDAERELIRRARKSWDLDREYEKLEKGGIYIVLKGEPEYPRRMAELPSMPYALYVRGRLPDDGLPSVAIVGARGCSAYGESMTLRIAEQLASCGVQVISGMARGIDAAGHRGALNGGGLTFAVMGCGADVCYPREHKGLYGDILERGGILSELPPGTAPQPGFFPARNRIISALSDLVLVMEAREKSGSLITADMALEQGRDVYALPGPINSPLSLGCHRLIRQGAGLLMGAQELLQDMGLLQAEESVKTDKKEDKKKIMLEVAENLVYSNLDLYPKDQETLLQLTGLPPQELSRILVSLQLKGYIRERPRHHYVRQEV